MQGRSFLPLLTGGTMPEGPPRLYYRYWMHLTHHDIPAHFGVRTRTHKLIFFYGLPLDATDALAGPTPPGWELYDLVDDPEEMHNVYGKPGYADIAAQLMRVPADLRRQVGDEDTAFPEVIARLTDCGWRH